MPEMDVRGDPLTSLITTACTTYWLTLWLTAPHMANTCPVCMANIDMVGRSHRCIPKPAVLGVTAQAARSSDLIPSKGPTQPVTVSDLKLHPAWIGTYKYRNEETRRQYMRDYMRKRRAGGA